MAGVDRLSVAVTMEMRLLQHLRRAIPEASDEELAVLLGLRFDEPNNKGADHRPFAHDQPPPKPPEGPVVNDPEPFDLQTNYPPKHKNLAFLCHTQTHWKEVRAPESSPPDWYTETSPFKDEITGAQIAPLPDPTPLSNWPAIWPVLHALFQAHKKTHRLDIPRLIQYAVKQTPIKELPWKTKRRWPNEIVLIIDTSRHLAPYISDYEWLAVQLQAWFKDKLRIVICVDSERQLYTFEGRHYDLFPPEISHTHCLYIGDLGFLDQQKISPTQWFEVGKSLARKNVKTHCLLTVSSSDIQPGFERFFDCYTWSESGVSPAAKAVPGQTGVSETSRAELEQLFALLSPAIEITSALVREIRQFYGMGVSVESLVIQHAVLRGHAVRFQWCDTTIKQRYHNQLSKLGISKADIWSTLKTFEQYLPVELQVEQRQQLGQSLSSSQCSYLRKLFKSGHTGSLNAFNQNMLLSWIERLARRAGDEVWNKETELLFALYFKQHKDDDDCIIPTGVDISRLPEWITQTSPSPLPVNLEQRGNRLMVTQEKTSSDQAAFRLAALSWQDGADYCLISDHSKEKKPLKLDSELSLDKTFHAIEISTATQTLTFEPLTCPTWAKGMGRDRFGLFVDLEVKGVPFVMRWIPPGEFLMGSPEDELERYDYEGPQHRVRIDRSYWLAEAACTQALWKVVTGQNPSRFEGSLEHPVENVSWNNVKQFIEQINREYSDLKLRLPSEAEWEYACRAGSQDTVLVWLGADG